MLEIETAGFADCGDLVRHDWASSLVRKVSGSSQQSGSQLETAVPQRAPQVSTKLLLAARLIGCIMWYIVAVTMMCIVIYYMTFGDYLR